TAEETGPVLPKPTGYKPITGTILDLLDKAGVNWVDYYSDVPVSVSFRPVGSSHVKFITDFLVAARTGKLPPVAFVDPNFGAAGIGTPTDEHPPYDIREGQHFISKMLNAVRNGPNWKDSVVFITYDEAGGFYDHVGPPMALQAGALN